MKNFPLFSAFVFIMVFSAYRPEVLANQPSSPVQNTVWKLQAMNGKSSAQAQQVKQVSSLVLNSEKTTARIATACNSGFMQFTLKGNALTFGAVMKTKKICPAANMQQEAEFISALEKTTRYQIQGEMLQLYDANNRAVASFQPLRLR
jgi:heat shock protein HslJ